LCQNCTPGRRGKCANSRLPGSLDTLNHAQSLNHPVGNSPAFPHSLSSTSSVSLSTDHGSWPSASCPELNEYHQRTIIERVRSSSSTTYSAAVSSGQDHDNAVTKDDTGTSPEDVLGSPAISVLPHGNAGNDGTINRDSVCTDGAEEGANNPDGNNEHNRLPDAVPSLPSYRESSAADFTWGDMNGLDFVDAIHCAYCEIVHWRRNVFLVPSGATGKEFVKELTRLFNAYAQASALESVALEAIMVASCLLLQKPYALSKTKDHTAALKRRLI